MADGSTGGTADDRTDPRVTRTRVRVLAAANELLLELGFHAITIDDISARSGVSRSTLYRHWTTREEILRDAFTAQAVPAEAPGDDIAADLAAELRHYALTFAAGLEQNWGRAAATLAVTAMDDAEQAKMMATFIDGYTADVGALLARARSRGEIVTDRSSAEVADRLVAPLFHRYLFRRLPVDEAFVAAQVTSVAAWLRA